MRRACIFPYPRSRARRTHRRSRVGAGFTLIELLVALVVLGTGLLAIQALTVAAARSVARADHRTEMTFAAMRGMEAAIRAIRTAPDDPASANGCTADARTGVSACTRVETRADTGATAPRTARITVTVRRDGAADESVTVTSHVFHPGLPE